MALGPAGLGPPVALSIFSILSFALPSSLPLGHVVSKVVKTIVVVFPDVFDALNGIVTLMDIDESKTIGSLQREIRRHRGLTVRDFVHLGYRRPTAVGVGMEIVLLATNKTVGEAWDLFITVCYFYTIYYLHHYAEE